jgi:branched-chain amino acid aminotransferase
MNAALLDGRWMDADKPVLTLTNRSFLYGDGLFESMLWKDGHLPFAREHLARLIKGMEFFGMQVPDVFNAAWLNEQCARLVELNNLTGKARIRLHVFRQDGSLYTPASADVHYLMTCSALPSAYNLPVKLIGIYDQAVKPKSRLSNFKTTSAALYVLAGLYARHHGYDEVFILNTEGQIIEAISSNVFILSSNRLITPPLTDGCLEGIMRQHVLSCCEQYGLQAELKSLSQEMIYQADEIFLTNAIAGIRSVLQFKDRFYKSEKTILLQQCLP